MRPAKWSVSILSEFDFPQCVEGHAQQKPAVTETADVGFAVASRAVMDRYLDNFQVEPRRAKEQVEITKRIEVAKVASIARDLFVIHTRHAFRSTKRIFKSLAKK